METKQYQMMADLREGNHIDLHQISMDSFTADLEHARSKIISEAVCSFLDIETVSPTAWIKVIRERGIDISTLYLQKFDITKIVANGILLVELHPISIDSKDNFLKGTFNYRKYV